MEAIKESLKPAKDLESSALIVESDAFMVVGCRIVLRTTKRRGCKRT